MNIKKLMILMTYIFAKYVPIDNGIEINVR